jgi:hypothetical protein
MNTNTMSTTLVAIVGAVLASASMPATAAKPAGPALFAAVSVYASGLNNPRGLKFEPDGRREPSACGPGLCRHSSHRSVHG